MSGTGADFNLKDTLLKGGLERKGLFDIFCVETYPSDFFAYMRIAQETFLHKGAQTMYC